MASQVVLPPGLPAWRRALLTDPQTSGGLLVACTAERAESIRAMIEAAGYPRASIIGTRHGRRAGGADRLSIGSVFESSRASVSPLSIFRRSPAR